MSSAMRLRCVDPTELAGALLGQQRILEDSSRVPDAGRLHDEPNPQQALYKTADCDRLGHVTSGHHEATRGQGGSVDATDRPCTGCEGKRRCADARQPRRCYHTKPSAPARYHVRTGLGRTALERRGWHQGHARGQERRAALSELRLIQRWHIHAYPADIPILALDARRVSPCEFPPGGPCQAPDAC
eukprot:scaffold30374_cov107-Isochrysis_galbana.AAC.12